METFKTPKAVPVPGKATSPAMATRIAAQAFTLGNKRVRTVLNRCPLVFMNTSGRQETGRSFTLGSGGAVCTVLKQNALCGPSAFMSPGITMGREG